MDLTNYSNTSVGMGFGMVGGVGKYLIEIPAHVNTETIVLHTILTALISAACGLLVKDVHGWIKRKIKR